MRDDLNVVWKALADETRRAILDLLRDAPRTTTEIVDQFPNLSRFGVMKHMDVLREAGLMLTREDGRRRVNSLNAVPIRMIYERWVSHYAGVWASVLVRVKQDAERVTATQAKARAKARRPKPDSTRQKPPRAARPPRSRSSAVRSKGAAHALAPRG